jgi:two-component system response regulator FixJ
MLPVVLLAANGTLSAAVHACKAGAFDVVERSDLVESVKKAFALFAKYQKLFEERAAASVKIASLTKRETQVFNLMVQGIPNRQIAEQIGISPKTLDIHRSNLMDKMEARTPADLCRADLLAKTNPMLLPLVLA